MNAIPKPLKVVQDEERLEFVRKMCCLILSIPAISGRWPDNYDAWDAHRPTCNGTPCEAHHVRKGTQAGLSRKPPASRTVPLCASGHREYHTIGHDTFCAKYGLDLEAHLLRINREFDASHPQKAQKRTKQRSCGLTVKNCVGCGRTHPFLKSSKWKRGIREIRYFCGKRNSYFVMEIQ